MAQVNCLALGHRSGRVLVTGGEDKKVNLWAVGKPNCIMSLSGHSSPIQSVRFGHTEELVCAGSESGALKIWDLEAARLVRTLTGHKAGISCLEFHPYGEYLASGSVDTCLKLWDTRRKGCIFSYKGHSQKVNCLRFSPDGQWIASGGEDGAVKLWDLRAGKLMNELDNQSGPVNDVEFHPHEFLLAAANQNRTISFWDLEKMALLGSSERETGPVRSVFFHPEGECMFSGTQDSLKVHGWEPCRSFDSIPMNWGKIADMATANQQLIGAAFNQSHVTLYVVDLKRVLPFSGLNIPEKEQKSAESPNVTFRPGQSVRRSFVKEKPEAGKRSAPAQMKISEETSDKSGTEGEDSDAVSHAEIPDISNYENVFQPRKRQLAHTPPPPDEPFEDPHPSDLDMPLPVRAIDPMNFHASKLNKKVSPSPTRRASQPAMPTGYHSGTRRGSITATNSDVMKPQEVHLRNNPHSGQRPASVYEPVEQRGGRSSASVPRELPSSPVRAAYRTAVNLNAASADQEICQECPHPRHTVPCLRRQRNRLLRSRSNRRPCHIPRHTTPLEDTTRRRWIGQPRSDQTEPQSPTSASILPETRTANHSNLRRRLSKPKRLRWFRRCPTARPASTPPTSCPRSSAASRSESSQQTATSLGTTGPSHSIQNLRSPRQFSRTTPTSWPSSRSAPATLRSSAGSGTRRTQRPL